MSKVLTAIHDKKYKRQRNHYFTEEIMKAAKSSLNNQATSEVLFQKWVALGTYSLK